MHIDSVFLSAVCLSVAAAAYLLRLFYRRPKVGTYFLLAILPLQSVNIRGEVVTLSPVNAVIILLATVLVVRALLRGRIARLPPADITTALVIVIALSTVATALARDVSASGREWVTLSGGILLASIIASTIRKVEDVRPALWALSISTFVVSGVTILTGFGLIPAFALEIGKTRAFSETPIFGMALPFVRNTGVMSTQGTYGTYVAIAAAAQLLSVAGVDRGVLFRSRGAAAFLLVVTAFGIIVTQSRTVWAGAVMVVGIAMLFRATAAKRKLARAFRVSTVLAIWVAATPVMLAIGDYYTFAIRSANTGSRLAQYSAALHVIAAHPAFGTGDSQLPAAFGGVPLHNTFLQFAISRGLPMLFAFGWVWIRVLQIAVRTIWKEYDSARTPVAMWVVTALLSATLQGMFFPGMSDKGMWALVGLGIAFGTLRPSQADAKQRDLAAVNGAMAGGGVSGL